MKSHKQPSIHRRLNRLARHRLLTGRRYRHIRKGILYLLHEWHAVEWTPLSCPLLDLSVDCGYVKLLSDDRKFRRAIKLIDTSAFDLPKSLRSNHYIKSDLSVLLDQFVQLVKLDQLAQLAQFDLSPLTLHRPRDSNLYRI